MIKINPSKCKAVSFPRVRVNDPLNYTLRDQLIREVSSCKYLGKILRSDLSWADHVNYTVKRPFIMRMLKKWNSSTKRLAYTTLEVRFFSMGLRAEIPTGRGKYIV